VQDTFGRETGQRLASVLELVAAWPAGDHSAAAMADRLGVTVRHLSRLFAQQTGVTPARYVERVRVAAAAVLLTATRLRLAEVAAQAGFGSAETMRRAFLRTVGVTPGAYRQRLGMSRSEGELSLRPVTDRCTLEPINQRDRPAARQQGS
jgi:transcriptional regulator GlxA family with amidase domain